jgi:SAM-dependent methyltransferase
MLINHRIQVGSGLRVASSNNSPDPLDRLRGDVIDRARNWETEYRDRSGSMMVAVSRTVLRYDPLERISVSNPVDRVSFIAEQCRAKKVLDIGCFDETALVKRETEHYLHGRISKIAARVHGVDSSPKVPEGGIVTGPNSRIVRGDGADPIVDHDIDIIVAGEFIEHIENPLDFFRKLKAHFPGKEMVISTPNGTSFANTLLGVFGREAQHPDHLQIFSYKILSTLCSRTDFAEWEIIPYRFQATETILNSSGLKKAAATAAQFIVGLVERLFPLLSCGYIVKAKL